MSVRRAVPGLFWRNAAAGGISWESPRVMDAKSTCRKLRGVIRFVAFRKAVVSSSWCYVDGRIGGDCVVGEQRTCRKGFQLHGVDAAGKGPTLEDEDVIGQHRGLEESRPSHIPPSIIIIIIITPPPFPPFSIPDNPNRPVCRHAPSPVTTDVGIHVPYHIFKQGSKHSSSSRPAPSDPP